MSGTIPFEADSDTSAIERGKELVRENIPYDNTIWRLTPSVGDTECVECALFRKDVHSYHHDDYEVVGCEGTDGADYVGGFGFDIKRTGSGDDDLKITTAY